MRDRIREADLNALVARINKAMGAPAGAYTRGEDGKCVANIGNYHLSHAYGGVCLHKMSNEHGSVSSVFECGHVPKRDLYERMRAFLCGLSEDRGTWQ